MKATANAIQLDRSSATVPPKRPFWPPNAKSSPTAVDRASAVTPTGFQVPKHGPAVLDELPVSGTMLASAADDQQVAGDDTDPRRQEHALEREDGAEVAEDVGVHGCGANGHHEHRPERPPRDPVQAGRTRRS